MYGYENPKPNHFSHVKLEPAAHDAHVSWKDQADRLVHAKSRNTKSAESDMLKGPHSMKGKHSYTTERYNFNGGNAMSGGAVTYRTLNGLVWAVNPSVGTSDAVLIPAIEAYKAASASGQATTEWMKAANNLGYLLGTQSFSLIPPKKGGSRPASIQPQIDALLKDRMGQYAAEGMAGFEAVSPERLYVPVPKVESFGVDTLFTALFQYVDLGDLKNALKQTSTIINTLLSSADKLEKDSFDTYLSVVRQCISIVQSQVLKVDTVQALSGSTETTKSHTETKRMLKALEKELEGIGEFLLKFIQFSNKPTSQRASLLANIRKSLLADTLKNPQTVVSPGFSYTSMMP